MNPPPALTSCAKDWRFMNTSDISNIRSALLIVASAIGSRMVNSPAVSTPGIFRNASRISAASWGSRTSLREYFDVTRVPTAGSRGGKDKKIRADPESLRPEPLVPKETHESRTLPPSASTREKIGGGIRFDTLPRNSSASLSTELKGRGGPARQGALLLLPSCLGSDPTTRGTKSLDPLANIYAGAPPRALPPL